MHREGSSNGFIDRWTHAFQRTSLLANNFRLLTDHFSFCNALYSQRLLLGRTSPRRRGLLPQCSSAASEKFGSTRKKFRRSPTPTLVGFCCEATPARRKFDRPDPSNVYCDAARFLHPQAKTSASSFAMEPSGSCPRTPFLASASEPGTRPSAREGTPARVRGKVPPKLGCRPPSCGCAGRGF